MEMPEVRQQIVIQAPIEEVWTFVNNLRNWATEMPGYQDFREIDADHSVWQLKGDAGILQKRVTFDARVTKREPPTRVEFTLHGIDEQLDGAGSFTAAPTADGATQVDLTLALEAGGLMGPVISALLAKTLPRDVARLAVAIKERVEAAAATGRTEAPTCN